MSACLSYQDILDKRLLRTRKLMNQWFIIQMLKSSLWKFIGRYHDLVNHCRKSVSEITIYMIRLSYCVRDYHIHAPFVVLCQRLPYIWSICRNYNLILPFLVHVWIFDMINTTVGTSGTAIVYFSVVRTMFSRVCVV